MRDRTIDRRCNEKDRAHANSHGEKMHVQFAT